MVVIVETYPVEVIVFVLEDFLVICKLHNLLFVGQDEWVLFPGSSSIFAL